MSQIFFADDYNSVQDALDHAAGNTLVFDGSRTYEITTITIPGHTTLITNGCRFERSRRHVTAPAIVIATDWVWIDCLRVHFAGDVETSGVFIGNPNVPPPPPAYAKTDAKDSLQIEPGVQNSESLLPSHLSIGRIEVTSGMQVTNLDIPAIDVRACEFAKLGIVEVHKFSRPTRISDSRSIHVAGFILTDYRTGLWLISCEDCYFGPSRIENPELICRAGQPPDLPTYCPGTAADSQDGADGALLKFSKNCTLEDFRIAGACEHGVYFGKSLNIKIVRPIILACAGAGLKAWTLSPNGIRNALIDSPVIYSVGQRRKRDGGIWVGNCKGLVVRNPWIGKMAGTEFSAVVGIRFSENVVDSDVICPRISDAINGEYCCSNPKLLSNLSIVQGVPLAPPECPWPPE